MKTSFTKAAIIIGLASALSFFFALIKFPSPVGSIAIDAVPGYFVAAYYSPVIGGIVGTIGHLLSAATAGFPLGYLHFVIAGLMFFNCAIFGLIARKIQNTWGLIPAVLVAIITNGILTPFAAVPLGLDIEMAKAILVFLIFGSAVNAALAAVLVFVTSKTIIRE